MKDDKRMITGQRGHPLWSAPETKLEYDERSDMWAVGCLIYFVCTGVEPFETGQRITEANLNLKKATQAYSKDLSNFLEALLVSSPSRRMTAKKALSHRWLSSSE